MPQAKITTLCYIEDGSRYLMMHRNKKQDDVNAGKWIGLGGHILPGETVRECIRREVEEESHLKLLSLNFRGIVYFSCGDDEEYMFVFTSDNFEGELAADCDEGTLEWVNKSDIGQLELWEGDRKFLPLLDAENRFFYMSLIYDEKGRLTEHHIGPELYQQEDVLKKYGYLFPTLGSRALIVTGRHSSRQNGSLADISETLDYQGVSYCLFDEVEENPSVDTIMKGRDKGIEFGADFVIGIGGGSPMDAAKAIALMIKNIGRGVDYLYENGNPSEAIPVVCIPTTCGTGSEATAVSVLTRPALNLKGSIPYRIMPEYGFSDIKYLRSMDMQILRNTALDAFAHLVESYINSKATDLSRAIAIQGLHKFRYVKESLLSKVIPRDDVLDDLLTMSTLAGMAIAIDGTGIPHAMSYPLTLDDNIPHGPSCAYFIPGYLEVSGALANPIWDMIKIGNATDLKELFCRLYHFERVTDESMARAIESVCQNEAKLATAPFYVGKHILHDIADYMR